MKYNFTKDWFINSEIIQLLHNYLDKNAENNMLEIGCFEGLSSTFFADNYLNNKNSKLTCVDPFLKWSDNDHKDLLQTNEELRFDYNISICNNKEKITIHKVTSDQFFETNKNTFNFIYIDGCHEPDFILRDMENSFKCLVKGGIMWMDDYGFGDGIQVKNTMHRFLEMYNGQYDLIHRGYQLAIIKK
jgi:predicted O-methyltransferase YrrM